MRVASERISFEEAIGEARLLKPRFSQLSAQQQVALKVLYGLPLLEGEYEHWAMFQESCVYDALGYVQSTSPTPYSPKEYRIVTLVWGRRSGKTDSVSTTAIAYEAALGGHEEFIRKGQTAKCFLMAQDLKLARANLPLVEATLRTSPLLEKQIANVTADELLLSNSIGISMVPANPRAIRGYAVPALCLDEVGLWYTDPESANADMEVARAARFAQLQFPFRKFIITSTPWVKQGLLWTHYKAGTQGSKLPKEQRQRHKGQLLLHTTTAGSGNPLITRADLRAEQAFDPEAFERESLARFSDSSSSFIPRALLEQCVNAGVGEVPPVAVTAGSSRPLYTAAMDPAFRNDSFAFTIVHRSEEGHIVQDIAHRMTPLAGEKLDPSLCVATVAAYCRRYGVSVVYSDQYQLESLQQLALAEGIAIEGVDFTGRSKPKIVGNLAALVNARALRVLDPECSEAAREQFSELVKLEKRMGSLGNIQVSAPRGAHDDMAMVLALAAHKTTWLSPLAVKEDTKSPTHFDKCLTHIKKKFQARKVMQW